MEVATQTEARAVEEVRAPRVATAEVATEARAEVVGEAFEEVRVWMWEMEQRIAAALEPSASLRAQHVRMLLQARRSGGRQRRRQRERRRGACWQPDEPRRAAFVGEEEAMQRFMAAATAHGMCA